MLLVILAGLLFNAEVQATNGYFSHGYSVQSKGMAGAGVAYPQSALAAASNPAGMVYMGNRFDLVVGLFNPVREYTITGNPSGNEGTFGLTPGTVESGSKAFVIPAFGMNRMINDKCAIGLSIYGNGGMNTNYPTSTYHLGSGNTGVNLMQLFIAATVSRYLNKNHSLGVTGIFGYQTFKAEGLSAFEYFSSNPPKLTNKDTNNSSGFGARFGYLGTFGGRFRIGASYQTKIRMSEFNEYAGLFAEQGDFDVPANWTVGISYDASKYLTLAADVQTIMYSDVNAVGNPMVPSAFYQGILLGDDDGAGFGWEDMTIFKFGLSWEGLADMPLRFGYSYGEQPIPESEMMFNILAPGVIEQHLTFGLTRKLCKGREVSLAITHALSNSVTGPNTMEVEDQQEIELKMHQWEFVLGFAF